MESINDIFDFLRSKLKILALAAGIGALLAYVFYLYNPGHRLAYVFLSPDPSTNTNYADPQTINRMLKDVFGNPEYCKLFSDELLRFLEEKQEVKSILALKDSFNLKADSSLDELAQALSRYFLINVPENILYRYLPYRWVYQSFEQLISFDLSNRYYFILKLPANVNFENYVFASQSALIKIIQTHTKNVKQIDENEHKQRILNGTEIMRQTGEQYTSKQKEYASVRSEFFSCAIQSRKLAYEALKKIPDDSVSKALKEAFEENLPPKSILSTHNLADAESSFAGQLFLQLEYARTSYHYLLNYRGKSETNEKLSTLEDVISKCEKTYGEYFTKVDAALRLVRVQLQAFTDELKQSSRLDRIYGFILPPISQDPKALERNLLASHQDPGIRNLIKYVSLGIAISVFLCLTILIFTMRKD